MRVTEFSIALPISAKPLIDVHTEHRAAMSAALGAALDRWRHSGAPAALSARGLLLGVCGRAADASLSRRMTIKTEIDEGLLFPASQAVRVELIAEALLDNAIAHAHPSGVYGEIVLRCVRDGDGALLEVADDGVGLPEEFDADGHRGGLTLAGLLCAEIGSRLHLNSGACGLQALVRIPSPSLVTANSR